MKEPRIGRLLAVILGLIAIIAPIAAATVTIAPDTIQENTPITVSVKDLPDGSTFMIRVEASIPLDSNGKYSLSTNNLQMPFALNGGKIDIRAENVKTANFSARMGGRVVTIFGDAENGIVTINQPGDIPQGLISYITLEGSGAEGAGAVTASMDLSGKKVGPTDADVTFTVNGFGSGSVNVKVYVDGSLVATVPASTPTTTTVPGGSSSGGETTTTPAADETLTVSSLNGLAVLTFERGALSGAGADDLTVMVSNRAVPEAWTALAGPFAILPSGATFNPSADFSITMTADEKDTSVPYTILGYTGGTWKALQSRIDGDTITASITAAGEYALVMPREEATVTTAATTAPTGTTTTAAAAETTAPATTPVATPLSLLCALGGVAAAGLLYRKLP